MTGAWRNYDYPVRKRSVVARVNQRSMEVSLCDEGPSTREYAPVNNRYARSVENVIGS